MGDRRKPILCLDFDGVLHSYTSGWKGADIIPDPPVPGAMQFLCDASRSFTVHIFSSRSNQPGGLEAMRRWVERHLEEHLLVPPYGDPGREKLPSEDWSLPPIHYPTEKPPASVTIDDRAITFTGEWPSIDLLLAFKPWNHQEKAVASA